METTADVRVDELRREARALERALLRRGIAHRDAETERCSRCRRTPLLGERVYLPDAGPVVCELCRSGPIARELDSRLVRGPDFGRTLRIIGDRAA
ncbi:MAG TPA: hypothetical protein VKR21_17385 [Solirubrobacteraceae bacterium]|nr:hypothetical protein [Solirubrobacteraceae bacterium]